MYMQKERKNIIFGENCSEIVEFCKKNTKNKKVDFRGRFFYECGHLAGDFL